MRILFYTLLLIVISGLPLRAEPESAVADVISKQIAEFERDDFTAAFGYASAGIQSIFRTPDNFERMVKQGYPMVWRPRSVTFLSGQEIGQDYQQDIEIIDQQGKAHYLRYHMINTTQGWKIDGVELLQGSPLAV